MFVEFVHIHLIYVTIIYVEFFYFSISISETKIRNYDQVRCPNPSGMSRSQEAFHTCEVLSGHKSLSVE